MAFWSNRRGSELGEYSPLITTPSFYQQLRFQPEKLTSSEIKEIGKNVFFLSGSFCLGKSTLMRELVRRGVCCQIPETKTRPPRQGESERETETLSITSFINRMSRNEFLISYVANLDERCQMVGISLDRVRGTMAESGFIGIIAHPRAAATISLVTGSKIFVVWSRGDDAVRFQEARREGSGVHSADPNEDEVLLPKEYTHFVENPFDRLPLAADQVERILQL